MAFVYKNIYYYFLSFKNRFCFGNEYYCLDVEVFIGDFEAWLGSLSKIDII